SRDVASGIVRKLGRLASRIRDACPVVAGVVGESRRAGEGIGDFDNPQRGIIGVDGMVTARIGNGAVTDIRYVIRDACYGTATVRLRKHTPSEVVGVLQ